MISLKVKREFSQAVTVSILQHPCTFEEKAKYELHENDASYFKQLLKAAPYKTAVVRPLTSDLMTPLRKTSRVLLEKRTQIHTGFSPKYSFPWTLQCWPTNKNLY